MSTSYGKMIGGILLVAGTATGAGMLALPVSTGQAGFLPSMALFTLCWILMTFTAFLMLEVNLWMENGANLITMAKKTLGRWGEVVSWITYLFLLYALTTAYIAGSGSVTSTLIANFTGYSIPPLLGALPLLLLFSFFVYKGTAAVDHINRYLMIGLVGAYAAMVFFLTPEVKTSLLNHVDWNFLWIAVSLLATSFGFHIIIPTLTTYLDRDIPKLKATLLIGSAFPLVVYVIWELLILGIIPVQGENGLAVGYANGTDGAHLLSIILNNSYLSMLALLFSFFAIVTSFLGVSLSLSDFLSDGLKIQKTRKGKSLIYLLTFAPPLLFTFTDPRAFFSALEYAGAFGVVVLLCLLPALMVWKGREQHAHISTYKAPGGKLALLAVIGCSIFIIGLEVIHRVTFNN